MILAGDIGGTKTLLAMAGPDGGVSPEEERIFRSAAYGGLEDVVGEYLKEGKERITSACFAVAGPVLGGRCETTNLPWVVDAGRLKTRFGIPEVFLLNDLEAAAYGSVLLGPEDLFVLNGGREIASGTRAVIAAGTGLGEAIMIRRGTETFAVASEGGHSDFAPRTPIEIRLLEHLSRRFGHVSYERILSGPGLANIHRFLVESGEGTETDRISARIQREDPGAVITEAALAGESNLCARALDLFVSIYGAESGNLALKTLSTGGLYIGGGIAPRILDKLRDGTFMNSFTDKGRYESLLARIPVRVILNPKTGLLGAARYASERQGEGG